MQVSEGASRSSQPRFYSRDSPAKWTKYLCHGKFYKRHRLVISATITPNGPAIKGGCVTRRQHRAGSRYFSQKAVTVQGGYGTCFCRHGTNFIAYWRNRGTSLIVAANLSPVTNLVEGTGAVSRRAPQKRSESGGTSCLGAKK